MFDVTNACRRPSRAARRRLARGAVALSSLALLGALPGSALATGWVEGPRLAVAANVPGVAVGVTPDGSVETAWSNIDSDGVPTELLAQHVAPDGTVAEPVSLGAGANPVIATSTGNSSAVAWLQIDPEAREARLHLTLLNAGGARTSDTIVATIPISVSAMPYYDVALDAAGNATIIWTEPQMSRSAPLQALRVRADGTRTDAVTLGNVAVSLPHYVVDPVPRVAIASDGSSWIGWVSSSSFEAKAARLSPAGQIDLPAVTLSAPGEEVGSLAMGASATGGGTAIVWGVNAPEPDPPAPGAVATSQIAGVRLGPGGAIDGSAFGVTGAMSIGPGSGYYGSPPFTIGVGPDGTITLAWLRSAGLFPRAALSRFAVGQSTAAAYLLDAAAGSDGEALAQVSVAPDGSAIATWQSFSLATGAQTPKAAQIAPDGSIGVIGPLPITRANAFSAATPMPRAANGAGAYAAAVISNLDPGTGRPTFTAGLYRIGTPGPTVTANVPASGVALTPIAISGTVSGAADNTLTWDFGDGSSARGLNLTHAYVNPGTYTVTARASDRYGVTTTVTRQITITPAQTGRDPAPTRTAARLKITRANRRGAKVTVRGTIDRRARGKVTIVYTQRAKRRSITVRRTATIAKGTWRAAVRLPRALTRGKAARTKGTVTVTFAGTAAIDRARATRTVSLVKPKRAKRPRK